jgi:hypothetical protein
MIGTFTRQTILVRLEAMPTEATAHTPRLRNSSAIEWRDVRLESHAPGIWLSDDRVWKLSTSGEDHWVATLQLGLEVQIVASGPTAEEALERVSTKAAGISERLSGALALERDTPASSTLPLPPPITGLRPPPPASDLLPTAFIHVRDWTRGVLDKTSYRDSHREGPIRGTHEDALAIMGDLVANGLDIMVCHPGQGRGDDLEIWVDDRAFLPRVGIP